MIDPKAEPIGHRSPYKRVDLAARRKPDTTKCEDCGMQYPHEIGDYCPKCGYLNLWN